MDMSLDDYMYKKPAKKKPISQRIGIKKSPIGKKTTTFKVTGLGKPKFDARQKLANKSVTDARALITKKKFVSQKISAPADARSKIINKTKFVDARVRIENKKANNQGITVQVENTKDARTKITFNRQNKGGQKGTGPQIRVTGLGNPNLLKITKTTKPERKTDGVRVSGDNLVITRNSQPESTDINTLPGNARAPIIKIKNDHYRPPTATTKKIPVHTTPRGNQSDFSRAVAASVMQTQHVRQLSAVHVQPTAQHVLQDAAYQQPVVQYVAVTDDVQYVAMEPAAAHHQPVVQQPVVRTALTHAHINPQFSGASARLGRKTAPQPTQAAPGSAQTFRVLITNLHQIVSQDDIVELFGAVGALKRARMLKPGTAEVIYLNKEDALAACRKYNNRELDGQPMQVQLTTPGTRTRAERRPEPIRVSLSPPRPTPAAHKPSSARSRRHITPPPPPPAERMQVSPSPPPPPHSSEARSNSKQQDFQPLTLGKNAPSCSLPDVDIGLINKALFKVKGPVPNRPVTFTVKI